MKNLADLLIRLWQGSQPASNTQVAAMAENRDRSSMADFVRILQAPTIKTSTAGVRGDRIPIGFSGPLGREKKAGRGTANQKHISKQLFQPCDAGAVDC